MSVNRLEFANRLVATLPQGLATMMNPYREWSSDDLLGNTPEARVLRLAEHLSGEHAYVLVGEAPGYRGCRVSGIAFTSEKLLLKGAIPRVSTPLGRLSSRRLPWAEASATIVWESLNLLGIADRTILWNAVQLHPFNAGNPFSNRRPTFEEVQFGSEGIRMLRDEFPLATFIAIGEVSAGAIAAAGVESPTRVRHPSFGGKTEFVAGLTAAIKARLYPGT